MYNYRSGQAPPARSYDHSTGDYFRDANRANGQQYYFRQHNLVAPVNTAQQLAAVRMSQASYNSNASGTGGGGHSMQPSHGAPHHQAPNQQQQSMPPPHAGMSYHQQQQQPSGPPYVIGPGQYTNTQQFTYRQQQPNSYQQHQSPTQQQQHQQQAGRPTFVGINAIPSSGAPRVPTSHPSSTPYLVQQQSSQAIRMPQQQQQALSGGMQQSQSQQSFMTPRSIAISTAHHQAPQQQLITTGHLQPQLVRVQQQPQQSPQQQQILQTGNVRMSSGPGQVQVIATSATNSGLMMPAQYTNQGVYQRPLILQQQPIVVQQPQSQQQQQTATIISAQQQPQTTIQYPYKQPQTLASQLQQGPQQSSVLPKQPAPSPSSVSSSASSTSAQFAAPNQMITKSELPAGMSSSPLATAISAAANSASASNAISDSGAAGSSGAQSDSSQVLTKQRLEDLVREVDPYEQLDEDVKETLLHIADEFIESVVSGACQIAKHRKAASVDVKDVQLCLERNWNMWIPGFGNDDIRPYKKACVTDAHKQRTALIKKTLKKI